MPAGLALEEVILKWLVAKGAITTEQKCWLGLVTEGMEKKTTEKAAGEKELKEAEGWTRVEIDAIEWEVEKAEGATGFTKIKNKNAITGFGKITGAEEKTLKEAVIHLHQKQSEDGATSEGVRGFGKLETQITVNKTSTVEIPAKGLVIELGV